MTNFNILYGDIQIYQINATLLNSLDDLYNENYMKKYNYEERYNDYLSFKEEQFFYKIKCNKNSLLKFEDIFIPLSDENITIKEESKKIILDFSKYKQKTIIFESDLSLYIGFLISSKLKENWVLDFSINNISYSLTFENDTFFQEVKNGDILKIEKPNEIFYAYIKTIFKYDIVIVKPLITTTNGIYVFDKNISEEYNTLIRLFSYSYYRNGKYSLCYGDPENYEYNQLISHSLEISSNPYKYLEKDDENKYFFIIYQSNDISSLEILKETEKNIILNELMLIEKDDNEILKLILPKFNDEKIIAFIQYFYFNERLTIYDRNYKIAEKDYGKDFEIYIFTKDMEPSIENPEKTASYKTFLFVSYNR